MSTRTEIQILPAVEADLPDVIELWQQLNEFHAEIDPAWEASDSAAQFFERSLKLALQSANAIVLCAKVEGKTLGYLHGMIKANAKSFREKTVGSIISICVDPAHRSLGLGDLLIESACDYFKENGQKRVETLVASGNDRGQSFWNKLAFSEHAVLRSRLLD